MRQPFSPASLAVALAGLVLAASPVVAGDFSGFYAGVNAGYAFEHSDRDDPPTNVLGPSAHDDGHALPPSAASSALATARRDRAGGSASARPR